ncbi:hypothetical protein Klosneuvirus_3_244 [Klosneuvirus KNV1]|uniref:Uncharacterized protein n=1 Tax=Klosneuvirus KNV1 TaxID=1977640 RepID=A0A1V0SK35_9VIRU|nr:hypothetical protein Klosneuvirus_3_244 [Klosneuvirus KNV1]
MDLHTIILVPGQLSQTLKTVCEAKHLLILTKESTYESASEALFNGAKFTGTLCLKVADGNTLVLPNAEDFITKKGTLQLVYDLTTRIPPTKSENYQFILVTDTTEPEPKSKEAQLAEYAKKYAKIMSTKEFTDYNVPKTTLSKPYELKVTSGLLTTHKQNGSDVTGHTTRNYNVSVSDAKSAHENNAMYIGQKYTGQIIKLMIDDGKSEKEGGHIVMVKDLGETAHITYRSGIKAALSGSVLEKYNTGVYEFQLQEIDSSSKQNPKIKVSKVGDTEVLVSGWYTYALEQK